jgi:hypothetical protein
MFFFEQDYKGINLLDGTSQNRSKYAISVFKKLFTVDEIKTGFLCDTNHTKSSRTILCQERTALLKKAVEIKFRIPSDCKAKTWKDIKSICNRHAYDHKHEKQRIDA